MKCLFIVGCPGSGKSFLANKLIASSHKDYILFDDINGESKPMFESALQNGKNCIVIDPHFCSAKIRDIADNHAKSYGADTEWWFFENNPKQCLINVEIRNDGRKVKEFINLYSKTYQVQDGAKTFPVFNVNDFLNGI